MSRQAHSSRVPRELPHRVQRVRVVRGDDAAGALRVAGEEQRVGSLEPRARRVLDREQGCDRCRERGLVLRERIGQLNVSPDLLQGLIGGAERKAA